MSCSCLPRFWCRPECNVESAEGLRLGCAIAHEQIARCKYLISASRLGKPVPHEERKIHCGVANECCRASGRTEKWQVVERAGYEEGSARHYRLEVSRTLHVLHSVLTFSATLSSPSTMNSRYLAPQRCWISSSLCSGMRPRTARRCIGLS